MEFKSEKKIKATLKLDDVVYEIKSPTLGLSSELSEKMMSANGNAKVLTDMMVEFISKLGNIPKEKLLELDNELFNDLFSFIIGSKKN